MDSQSCGSLCIYLLERWTATLKKHQTPKALELLIGCFRSPKIRQRIKQMSVEQWEIGWNDCGCGVTSILEISQKGDLFAWCSKCKARRHNRKWCAYYPIISGDSSNNKENRKRTRSPNYAGVTSKKRKVQAELGKDNENGHGESEEDIDDESEEDRDDESVDEDEKAGEDTENEQGESEEDTDETEEDTDDESDEDEEDDFDESYQDHGYVDGGSKTGKRSHQMKTRSQERAGNVQRSDSILDEKPTLGEIVSFKWKKNGEENVFKVREKFAGKWKDLGRKIGISVKLDTIEIEKQKQEDRFEEIIKVSQQNKTGDSSKNMESRKRKRSPEYVSGAVAASASAPRSAAVCKNISELDVKNAISSVTDWFQLGEQLGMEFDILEEILRDFDRFGTRRQRSKLVNSWLKSDPEASWSKLCRALERMGENTVAQDIRQRHL